MPRAGRARQDLEDVWRERVKAASIAYEKARKKTAAALQRCTDGTGPSEADFRLLKDAQDKEANALTEYMQVLRILHDLVVHHKDPIG